MNNETIKSITIGPRQTNIELLRLIAMFFVLVCHVVFGPIDQPSLLEFYCHPTSIICITLLKSISIISVNLFIIISGWFGIKASLKSFTNFAFQCLYFLIGIYVVMLICGKTDFSIDNIVACTGATNWFILSYIGLYILSPVLNKFCETSSKVQFRSVLISFFLFQTLYGWPGAAKYFAGGYSAISFIGLYLLARYIRLYGTDFKIEKLR